MFLQANDSYRNRSEGCYTTKVGISLNVSVAFSGKCHLCRTDCHMETQA